MGGVAGRENLVGSPTSLLMSLTDHMPSFVTYHCAMIGLDSSGKTTVLYRLKFDQYVNATPTIGFNCEKVRFNGSSFTVWDVGGQDKLRPLWRSYTRCTDGIIFVVDSCKEDRLEEAKLELLRMCKMHNSVTKPFASSSGRVLLKTNSNNCSNVPVLVLANKQDLPVAMDVSKIEELLGLKELSNWGVSWHLQPTCAVTGEGLDEAMHRLQDMIVLAKKGGGKRPFPPVNTTTAKPPQSSNESAGIRDSKAFLLPVSSGRRRVRRSHSHVR